MTQFDPYTNERPYGLLTPEERAELKRKGPWEAFGDDGWYVVDNPLWVNSFTYRRAKPATKPLTVATEVWAWMPAAVAIARDEDGQIHAYSGKPEKYKYGWVPEKDVEIWPLVMPADLIDPGTCHWKEAIAYRPKGA